VAPRVILDAGALIALTRGEKEVRAIVDVALQERDDLRTHAMVVAQVWRATASLQAVLSRALRMVDVIPIDESFARRCGELLGKARTSDPIDAGVVLLARDREEIVTSDGDDIRHLADVARARVVVIEI
jgi:predicted nucleic acid-binding protein